MSAVKYDLALEQGADYIVTFQWQDSTGANIDLTDYTAAAQARAVPGSASTLFSLTDTDGITLGGTAGTIAIDIPAATTLALGTGTLGVWDIKLTAPGGTVYRFAYGNVTCTAEVTV